MYELAQCDSTAPFRIAQCMIRSEIQPFCIYKTRTDWEEIILLLGGSVGLMYELAQCDGTISVRIARAMAQSDVQHFCFCKTQNQRRGDLTTCWLFCWLDVWINSLRWYSLILYRTTYGLIRRIAFLGLQNKKRIEKISDYWLVNLLA